MKNYWIHKIVYKCHRLGFYIRSVEYYYQDNHLKMNKLKCLLKAIFTNLKIFNYRYGYYEYLEIPITTMCSLKCKHCSNLIPCYKRPSDYDFKILEKSINAFLECINNIVYIRVLGGEPFLGKNLYGVLDLILKSNKVQRIEVVTNGTIIPKDKKLIEKLQNNRVIVCISVYPNVDDNKLVAFLKENNIKYRLDEMDYWIAHGDTKKRNRTEKELRRQYAKCDNVCKSLVNGQIHICPRSSHGTDLGIIKNNEDDYINILDDNLTPSEKRKQFNKLLKTKSIKACDYCDYGTKKAKKIPVAEQIKLNKK